MRWEGRLKLPILVLALAGVTALCLSACGGGGGSSSDTGTGTEADTTGGSSSAVAAALKIAEEHTAVDAIGPTEPINKPIPSGKKIVYVNCGLGICKDEYEAFKEAADVLGWTVETIPTEATPQAVQASMEEAIRRKPDGIITSSLGPSLYPRQLAKMNELGIVVGEISGEPGNTEHGVTFDSLSAEAIAKWMRILANKAIADMGGEGEIGTVFLTGYTPIAFFTKAWENEIESKCPKCTLNKLEVQPTSIGTDAAEKIANFVRANPGIKALFFTFDPLAEGLPAAIKNSGLEYPLTYSFAAEAPGIEALHNEERTADVPSALREVNWQAADEFARAFTGVEPVQQPAQEPIIWAKSFNNVPEPEPYPTINPNYKEQFEKLWGLK